VNIDQRANNRKPVFLDESVLRPLPIYFLNECFYLPRCSGGTRAGSRTLGFRGPVLVHIERWLQFAAMARRAIDQWGSVFEALDVSQEVKNDSVRHFRHVPSDLFGWFVVFFPLAWKMTMGATHAKRPAVTDLHTTSQPEPRSGS
jgi:hypothetical protein